MKLLLQPKPQTAKPALIPPSPSTAYAKPVFTAPSHQDCACEGGCPRCIQTKPELSVDKHDSVCEREADQLADRIMDNETQGEQTGRGENLHVSPGTMQTGMHVQRKEEARMDETMHRPEPTANAGEEQLLSDTEVTGQEDSEGQPAGETVMPAGGENQTPMANPGQEEEKVQAKTQNNKTPTMNTHVSNHIHHTRGLGQPLPQSTRTFFEGQLNRDLGDVRVHANSGSAQAARQLNAKAFTAGKDIYFGQGQYAAHSTSGQWLLAHELIHVMQQNGSGHGSLRRKPIIQCYSASAAVAYAKKHATSPNTTSYVYYSGGDCTNFVSQSLYAGGWAMLVGSSYCDDRKKDSVWWYRTNGCKEGYGCFPGTWACLATNVSHHSHTWGGAENFYWFMKGSGRGTALAYWDHLQVGDVLQRSEILSDHVEHTMIVTRKTPTNFYLTYHTNNTLERPFYSEAGTVGFLDMCPTPFYKYFAWKVS